MLRKMQQWTHGLAVLSLIAIGSALPASAAAQSPLAWITFDQGPNVESFDDTAYLWLGRVDIALRVDVPPSAGHSLILDWGSKNDLREATVEINAHRQTVHGGGDYSGFRALRVEIPSEAMSNASGYDIVLRQGGGKAAFLHGVRLVADRASDTPCPPAMPGDSPRHHMRLVSLEKTLPEAFPEMRSVWDSPPPAPCAPLGDAALEAAFDRAEANARRASEALYRCRRFVDGWLTEAADPKTGLIPRNLRNSADIWNAKDAAADNYPFMVLTAALTDRALFEGRMHDMLETEQRLTCRLDRLPDTYRFSTGAFADAEPDLYRMQFGGSEYVKDGLLPLTEWLGTSPWSERMLGIVDDLWKHADVDTPYGKIPTTNVEVHGEMLQSLSRIYWMTGEEKYLDWAIRLGDLYLRGDHHPTRDLASLRLRDHGCEVVSGLCELYAAVHFARPEKKKAYREPVHAMLDRILEIGRNEHGMLHNTIRPQEGTHDAGICDTWGYNYNGFYTVYLLDGTEAYRDAVRLALASLEEHLTDYDWGSADEYADSIEGGLNLYNREPIPAAAAWVDSEIRDMWSKQQPSGIIEGWHGDGNSARTNIMYALWKTQGLYVTPWRDDVRVGAVLHRGRLCVSLLADRDWRGRLRFDTPRHRTQMRLPLDYPRINQFPQWFTVDAEATYTVQWVSNGDASELEGGQLAAGLPVELEAGREVRLIVERR